jgi:hypothetical protein
VWVQGVDPGVGAGDLGVTVGVVAPKLVVWPTRTIALFMPTFCQHLDYLPLFRLFPLTLVAYP